MTAKIETENEVIKDFERRVHQHDARQHLCQDATHDHLSPRSCSWSRSKSGTKSVGTGQNLVRQFRLRRPR